MIQLNALGRVELRGPDGRELTVLLSQPKRLALLLYLTLATPRGYHRRDRLLALLWPELDHAHARGALNQSLHLLRRALGDGVIVRRGHEQVGIREGYLECDAVAFERAVADRHLETAIELYRGDLLDGFFVKGAAPEFDQWLEEERDRLRGRAVRAATGLAAREEAAGNLDMALHWASRASRLVPYDEDVFRRRLQLLRRVAGAGEAVRSFNEFARKLQEDIGVEPSDLLAAVAHAETDGAAIAEAAVQASGGTSSSAATGPGNGDGTPEVLVDLPGRASERTRNEGRRSPVRLVRIGLVALAASLITFATATRHDGYRQDRSLTVLPFENATGQSRWDVLAAGLQGAITAQLMRVPTLVVVRDSRAHRPIAGSVSLSEIAAQLGVGQVLEGRVHRAGARIWVSAQLTNARTGQHVWADQYEYADTALFTLQNAVALAIVEALRARLTPDERERLTAPPTWNAEAMRYFARGREYQLRAPGPARRGSALGLEEIQAAERLFERAIELDPNFALAHAHLAQVHGELFFFGYDRSSRRREVLRSEAHAAVRLQPDLPEARLAMGWYWYLAKEDYDRALIEFEAAREGMPNDPHLWMMIANVHRRRARWDDALFGYQRAFRLDPHHSDKAINLARTYLALRRYSEAAAAWDAAIAIDPDNFGYTLSRGRVFLLAEGRTDSLEAALERIPTDYDPSGATTLARGELAYLQRRPAEAIAALSRLLNRVDDASVAVPAWILIAQSYEMVGDSLSAREHYEGARTAAEHRRRLEPAAFMVYAQLGLAYAGLGREEEARVAADKAMKLVPLARDAWSAPWAMVYAAETYARIGDIESAVTTLRDILAVPNEVVTAHTLRLEPRWDPLRGDAGFRRLLQHASPG